MADLIHAEWRDRMLCNRLGLISRDVLRSAQRKRR